MFYKNKYFMIETTFLSENLKTIREYWNYGQNDFGEKFGLKRNIMYTYESGKATPSIEVLLEIEAMTGISIRELCTRKLQRLELPERPYREGEGIAKLSTSGGQMNVNVANGHGSAATQQLSASVEVEHMKALLAEKERLIQVLLAHKKAL